MTATLPDVLITDGDYFGSLAAARTLSRAGHRVVAAVSDPHCFLSASRHVDQTHRCPPSHEVEQMAQWLETFGSRNPGMLLYPCSDNLAWIISMCRDRLESCFRLFQPPLSTIRTLLNKQRLYGLAHQLGIEVPRTLYPDSEKSMREMASGLEGEYLVKPKTQVGVRVGRKSDFVSDPAQLASTYFRFRATYATHPALADHDPALTWPMLQAFERRVATGTISVAGFCTSGCEVFLALSSRKVLQYPRRIGTGLCFESQPLDPDLEEKVRGLCKASGYFGVFEAEFACTARGYELLDFNPRFYGQMQLEIFRGLDLPGLVVAATLGEPLPLPVAIRKARLSHRSRLKLITTTQFLAGRMPREERNRWMAFGDDPQWPTTDHIQDSADPAPARLEGQSRYTEYLRHPRSSLKTLFGDE